MSMSPPVPIPIAATPVAIPAIAIPVAVPVAILFAVPVLSAIERQEQCECIGQTSLLEKRVIIIQQLIVINEGRLRSFDKAAVQVDATGMHCHHTAECMASLMEAKFLCYLGRPPSVPSNEKSGGIHLDTPHFTMWLHLSMLIDIQRHLSIKIASLMVQFMVRLLTSTHSPFTILMSVIFELYVPPLKGNYCRLSIRPTMSRHTI
jgi:hypothetical protein